MALPRCKRVAASGQKKEELERVLELAERAPTEGRDSIQGLRSSVSETDDLALSIGALVRELSSDAIGANRAEYSVEVEGTLRALRPILCDEVYWIAREALSNAFRHADARRIDVAIEYGERQFRLHVRDDGKGIDPDIKAGTGHWGLRGMRERAELIGGNLDVRSQCQSGTQIELRIPASITYAAYSAGWRSRLLSKMPFSQRTGTKS